MAAGKIRAQQEDTLRITKRQLRIEAGTAAGERTTMTVHAHYRNILLAGAILALMAHAVSADSTVHKLAPCPDSPNCVSSQSDDKHRYIKPFSFHDTPVQAMQRLGNALRGEKRITLIDEEGGYLHAEARSLIFRFVDDLEFVLAPDAGLIHVRSAARTGYSDFGVNRRRLERIRRSFNSDSPAP